MRRIRLDDLLVPDGWEDKAAAAAAEVAGADAADRSAVIKKHDKLWGELKNLLADLSSGAAWVAMVFV